MSDLSIRVWLANPRHGLINAAQLQMKLDEETTSNMVQQLDLAALTPVKSITEIQNLLSNSKVRKVIHSGRITFRVLTNYIPRFGELHSAVMANYIPHFPVGPRPRPAVSA
jgi:hypothetical protein